MVGDQIDGWRPIHDNHAIEVMAVVVTFSQPIPDMLLKRILRASEDIAVNMGLKSRHAVSALQFAFEAGGISQSPASLNQGRIFSAHFEPPEGPLMPSRLAEQLQIQHNAIIYRTWRYVSWTWQVERIRKLMSPAIEGVSSTVGQASIRLEYLDRFRYDGGNIESAISGLLRTDSPFIAPHVFSAVDLWHSHTGAFVTSGKQSKRLQQVMADAIDEPPPPQSGAAPVRWVNITTAIEDRFNQSGENDEEINLDAIFRNLDSMHILLKDVLESVITSEMAERIYLRGS